MTRTCPWCNTALTKVNDKGVSRCETKSCTGYGSAFHYKECRHSNYHQYRNHWFAMKRCVTCGEYFDVVALRPKHELATREKIFLDFAERLRIAGECG